MNTEIYGRLIRKNNEINYFKVTVIGRDCRTKLCRYRNRIVEVAGGDEAMKRLLTVALSVVLFTTVYSWISYMPMSQREPNVYYFGFLKRLFLSLFMLAPFIFL
ncbi:hypothetical protein FH966_10890 [Lentibacillus cibarius]|uniref:Uncharacterized protein n=1 Tax=Lentibacillus cibarius TaxID=2583219 RepID=A0A549YJU4_9BACI|nr:hypothetical protein [Lentibacillus cibarius]TRM12148.1 hypothetical protein FH966_10890 [Lentibacillus cibarius]